MATTNLEADVVELPATDGVAFVEQSSPLTRLHYFDGQFLRAASLTTEQDYHRHALQLANLAGGWGAVHGFGLALAGDTLSVSPGLGITPDGQLVLAGSDMKARLADLLSTARPPAPGGKAAFDACLETKAPTATASVGLQVYEITVGPIDGLCGNEAVFGKLCETACASDSRRPYWREGVVLRLRPVALDLPHSASVPATTAHLRNRIASAYFAREPGQPPSLLSAAGLASGVWCEPAQLYHRGEVVIGLLWRDSGVARIDAWSGRRERMDTQPRAYWQGRMAMRPWNAFTAQILQFQCQLSGLFDANSPVLTPADDCDRIREALDDARREIEAMVKRFEASSKGLAIKSGERASAKRMQDASAALKSSYADLAGLSGKLADAGVGGGALPQQRMLINAGFFDLPPAGYLPVSHGSDVRPQCERMFGEGVALHFHAVRPDEIAHLVEEAEHLDRISLTRGLDDPGMVEQVEVFVPAGQVRRGPPKAAGGWWAIRLEFRAFSALSDVTRPAKGEAPAAATAQPQGLRDGPASAATGLATNQGATGQIEAQIDRIPFDGLVRTEARADGSFGFAFVVGADLSDLVPNSGSSRVPDPWLAYVSGDVNLDPFELAVGGSARLQFEMAAMFGRASETTLDGSLTVLGRRAHPDGTDERLVQLDLLASSRDDKGTETSNRARLRLLLQRDGDDRAGAFVADDERQNPTTSPMYFDWSSNPRRASMSVNADKAGSAISNRLNQLRGLPAAAAAAAVEASDAVPAAASARARLMDMSGLPDMPALGSDLATEALNRLAAIAEAANDPAFLLRARRRLLPTLDAPRTETVLTAADWVMFRRARTHLCGPACTTPPATTLETFQVWHLKLDDDKLVDVVKKAIDNGDAKALAAFKFTRVGLLRYRDDSAFSDETDAQVVAMWQAAKPGAAVVLGRVWEVAPTTGQGWQNHMRLRHMVDTIDAVTKAPPTGDGSLAVAAPPPGELGDKATDGGMLVVTIGRVVEAHNHRVVMLPHPLYRALVEEFQVSPREALDNLERFLGNTGGPVRDKDARFSQLQLSEASATALQAAHEEMSNATRTGPIVFVYRFVVSLKPIDADVQPLPEHEEIAKLLELHTSPPPNSQFDGSTVTSDLSDLGRGAQVLSLLGYPELN